MPSSLLLCCASTTEDELRQFYNTVCNSLPATFAVCGIDTLSTGCLPVLLEVQHAFSDLNIKGTRVVYLCYKQEFASSWPDFSHVDRLCLPTVHIGQLATCYNRCGLPGSSRFKLEVVTVSGPTGCGKSYAINDMCLREDGCRPLAIDLTCRNDFSDLVSVLADECSRPHGQLTRSLHFRIAPNAILRDIDQAFLELIWCGVLCGERDTLFALEPNPPYKWKWFIEFSKCTISESEVGGISLQPQLKFVHVAASNQSLDFGARDLELQEEHKQLVPVLDHFFSNRLGLNVKHGNSDIPCDLVFEVSETYSRDMFRILCREYDVNKENHIQMLLFLRYIYTKWQAMVQDSQLVKEAAAHPYLAMEVMHQVIQESVFLSRPSLQCAFHECSQSFLMPDCRGLVASPTAQEKIPTTSLPVLKSRFKGDVEFAWRYIPLKKREYLIEILSGAFQISFDDVERLLRENQFVLTPDFTFKLLLLHQRRLVRKPVILEGETGVGKTYLLKMYSLLQRHASEHSMGLKDAICAGERMVTLLKTIIFSRLWRDMTQAGQKHFPHRHSDGQFTKDTKWLDVTAQMLLEHWKQFLLFLRPESRSIAEAWMRTKIRSWWQRLSILESDGNIATLLDPKRELQYQDSLGLMKWWFTVKTKDLFRKVLVHPGLTIQDIELFLAEVSDLAEATPSHVIVVFFDEVNTSSLIGTFKEIMVDNTFKGNPISHSHQLFFVGAINPYTKPSDRWTVQYFPTSPGQAEESLDQWQDELGQEYNVVQLPEVMQYHKWVYKTLHDQDLEVYTRDKINFLKCSPFLEHVDQETEFSRHVLSELSSFLLHAYQYCRNHVAKSFVSQRDVQRVFKLIPHFWKMELKRLHPYQGVDGNDILRKCILLSIALAFYVRFPTEPTPKYPNVCRTHFDQYVVDAVKRDVPARDASQHSHLLHCRRHHSLKNVLEDAVNEFVTRDHFHIPEGVALTAALKENIYCIVACIQQRIPLAIIGEPGSSKSLSYRIVWQNLRGEYSSKPFCRDLAAVDSFFCQCSPDLTTSQITKVFDVARAKQHDYEEDIKNFQSETLDNRFPKTTVYIDEAGLFSLKKNRMVMKALHPYLDEPEVSFVALSNHWFDAANTNRMLTVLRSRAVGTELMKLAIGCIGAEESMCSEKVSRFLQGICNGYARVVAQFPKWFHQRDLIAAFRQLKREQLVYRRAMTEISVCSESLLGILQENFGGLEEQDCRKIAGIFFEEVHGLLPLFPRTFDDTQWLTPVEVLLKIKHDCEQQSTSEFYKNTNVLTPRFQLLVDDYGCDHSIVDLLHLYMHILPRDTQATHIYQLSGLSGGDDEVNCASVLASIRQSLDKPCTTVIVNSPKLHGYLYDLLNQSYRTMTVDGEQFAYVNVAMKDSTFPSKIHPQFRCIVIMDRHAVRRERTPFLSRFSKFSLHPGLFKQYVFKHSQFPTVLEEVFSCCKLFIESLPGILFYGCGRGQTLENTLDLLILKHVYANVNNRYQLKKPCSIEATRSIISHFYLLMPVSSFITVSRSLKPQAKYSEEYFQSRRSSFTFSSLLADEVAKASIGTDCPPRKLFVFTNSSASAMRSLTAPDSLSARTTCFGKELANRLLLKDCKDFQSFSEAQEAVEKFINGLEKCFIIAFDVSQRLQRAAIGPVKRLIEKTSRQQSSPPSTSKVFVLLLHSWTQPMPARGMLGAFLDGWTSYFTSIDSASHTCPVRFEEFLSRTHWMSRSNLPPVDNTALCERLRQLLENEAENIAREFCRRLSKDDLIHTKKHQVPEKFRAALNRIKSHRHPATCPLRINAVKAILTDLPVYTAIAHGITIWMGRESTKWMQENIKRISSGSVCLSIVDLFYSKMSSVLRDTLQIVLLTILEESNLGPLLSFMKRAHGHELVSKLLKLINPLTIQYPNNVSFSEPTFSEHSAAFFRQLVQRVTNAILITEEPDNIQRLHVTFKKDPVLDPLLVENAYLESCIPNYLSLVLQWGDPRVEVFGVAKRFVTLGYENCRQVDTDLLAFMHVVISTPANKSALLALLNGSSVLYRLNSDVSLCLMPVLSATNQTELLKRMAVVLIRELWRVAMEVLDNPEQSANVKKDYAQLLHWQQMVGQVFQNWPFNIEQVKGLMPLSMFEQAVQHLAFQHTSKVKLMAIADLILASLTKMEPVHAMIFLSRYLKDKRGMDIPLESNTKVLMADALEQLLLVSTVQQQPADQQYPSAEQPQQLQQAEVIKLRLACIHWLEKRLTSRKHKSIETFVQDPDIKLLVKFMAATGGTTLCTAAANYQRQISVPALLSAKVLERLEASLSATSEAQEAQVRRAFEELIDREISRDFSMRSLRSVRGVSLSRDSAFAFHLRDPESLPPPLLEASFEFSTALSRLSRSKSRTSAVDEFEFHVNRVSNQCTVEMTDACHGVDVDIPQYCYKFSKMAVTRVAIETAVERLKCITTLPELSLSMELDRLSGDGNMAKLYGILRQDPSWRAHWLWCATSSVDPDILSSSLAGLSAEWVISLRQACAQLAPLAGGTAIPSQSRPLACCKVFPAFTELDSVSPIYASLQSELQHSSAVNAKTAILLWMNNCLVDTDQELSGIKEGCALWLVFFEYTRGSKGEAVHRSAVDFNCSPLFGKVLKLLEDPGRACADFHDSVLCAPVGNCQLQDVFLSTMVAILALGPGHHLYTCATDPSKLKDSLIFGEESNRPWPLPGRTSIRCLVDRFPGAKLSAPPPGHADKLHPSTWSVPRLTPLALLLNSIHMLVALCWNAVLFPDTFSDSPVDSDARTGADAGCETVSGGSSVSSIVHECLLTIQEMMKLLVEADINMSRFSAKALVLTSLHRVVDVHLSPNTLCRAFYSKTECCEAAMAQFQCQVVEPALTVHCQLLNNFLEAEVSNLFASIHWLELSKRYQGIHDVWFQAMQTGHRILSYFLEHHVQLLAVRHICSVMKLYILLHKQLAGKITLEDVVAKGMRVSRAIETSIGDSRLVEAFNHAKDDLGLLKAALGQRSDSQCWFELNESTLLRDVLRIRGSAMSKMSELIYTVLSWQQGLCTCCLDVQQDESYRSVDVLSSVTVSLQESHALPEEIVARNGVGLLYWTASDLEDLLTIHCQIVKDDNMSSAMCLNTDLESLEKNLITGFLSKLRQIDWAAFERSFVFRFEDGERMAIFEWRATPTTPVQFQPSTTQEPKISKVLENLSQVAIEEALFDVQRLMRDLEQKEVADDLQIQRPSLEVYLEYLKETEGSDYSNLRPFQSFLYLDNIAALCSRLERWLLSSERSLSHIPSILSLPMQPDAKEKLRRRLGAFFQERELKFAVNCCELTLHVLHRALPLVEKAPDRPISTMLNSLTSTNPLITINPPEHEVSYLFKDLPPGILGYQYKKLLSLMMLYLHEKQGELINREAFSHSPIDPCLFDADPETLEQYLSVKLHVRGLQHSEVTLKVAKSSWALEVISRALERLDIDEHVACYQVGQPPETFLEDTKLSTLLSSSKSSTVEIWIILAKSKH